MSTRSCAHSPSTSLTITRHQVKSLFTGLCNSFANCCCQLIFSLDGFFSFLRDQYHTSVLCLSYFLQGNGSTVCPCMEQHQVILTFFCQPHSYTFHHLYIHRYLRHTALQRNLWHQLVGPIFPVSLLYCYHVSVFYVVDYRALCIYTLVVSIHFLVWVIQLLLSVYLLTHHMDQIQLPLHDSFQQPIY